MIETYNLDTPEGVKLELTIDANRASATIINSEVINAYYLFRNLDINFLAQEITVFYCYCQSVEGQDLVSEERSLKVAPDQFNYFLNLASLNANRILKHALNGILFKEYGYRCFNEAGEFINYVAQEVEPV